MLPAFNRSDARFVFFVLSLLIFVWPCASAAGEYNLSIGRLRVGDVDAIAVNGQIPGPTLRFVEGEDVVIHVTNRLTVPSSIHWHGMLVPAAMDGVPGLNHFDGIKPGDTFTYRFHIRQSGTYWYHAHSGFQEQAGLYGPIVITPAGAEPVKSDRDYVVMLSDRPSEKPERIFRNLKADSDYYNHAQRTVPDFFHDVNEKGLSATLSDRFRWGGMRMDPTDLSDVTGYTFLVNGKGPDAAQSLLFKPGERIRLRFINGASMTYFDVHIPGLKMTVVSADGQDVQPVSVDEFRISPAETYDVIVTPRDAKAFAVFAQAMDRSGYALASLTPRDGLLAVAPAMYPRALLTMADMGGMSAMVGMNDASKSATDMSGMGMSGMDMSGMDMTGHDGMVMAMPEKAAKSAPAEGWAGGYPAGETVLSYADLRASKQDPDVRDPDREIVVHLTGNMERFIWGLNNRKFGDGPPMDVRDGEWVKLTLINDTMMAHPMHLHGMFVRLLNGQSDGWQPKKHTVNVPPGKTVSVLLHADEPGEWAFHCHLLYHMAAGMMTALIVEKKAPGS